MQHCSEDYNRTNMERDYPRFLEESRRDQFLEQFLEGDMETEVALGCFSIYDNVQSVPAYIVL